MNTNYIILALICLGVAGFVILALIAGKGMRQKKEELLKKLTPLKDRVDKDQIASKIKSMPLNKATEFIDTTIEKFSLIDSISDLKQHISNYSDLISSLEIADIIDVRRTVISARAQIERSLRLEEKYGEEIAQKLIDQNYFLGMTEEQLIDSKGEPTKIETEVMKTKTKVIYIYGNKSSGDVFNFVNGELERFTDR